MSGTWAISTTSRRELSSSPPPPPLQSKAPKEIHATLTETLTCFLPGRAKDLSAPCRNVNILRVNYIIIIRINNNNNNNNNAIIYNFGGAPKHFALRNSNGWVKEFLGSVFFLLDNSPASEFYMPTFRNNLFHLHTYPPMKLKQSVPKRRHI